MGKPTAGLEPMKKLADKFGRPVALVKGNGKSAHVIGIAPRAMIARALDNFKVSLAGAEAQPMVVVEDKYRAKAREMEVRPPREPGPFTVWKKNSMDYLIHLIENGDRAMTRVETKKEGGYKAGNLFVQTNPIENGEHNIFHFRLENANPAELKAFHEALGEFKPEEAELKGDLDSAYRDLMQALRDKGHNVLELVHRPEVKITTKKKNEFRRNEDEPDFHFIGFDKKDNDGEE